jgi:hypothetical protein
MAKARAAQREKLLDQVDPDRTLPEEERREQRGAEGDDAIATAAESLADAVLDRVAALFLQAIEGQNEKAAS